MTRQRRYLMEEHARMGRDLYRTKIEPQLGKELKGKIVAIDIDTGEFEIADKGLTAAKALLLRLPDAQIWCERVGYPAVRTFYSRLTHAARFLAAASVNTRINCR